MSSSTLGNIGFNHEFLNSRAPLRFAAAFDGRSSRFRVYDNAPSYTVHAAFEENLCGHDARAQNVQLRLAREFQQAWQLSC